MNAIFLVLVIFLCSANIYASSSNEIILAEKKAKEFVNAVNSMNIDKLKILADPSYGSYLTFELFFREIRQGAPVPRYVKQRDVKKIKLFYQPGYVPIVTKKYYSKRLRSWLFEIKNKNSNSYRVVKIRRSGYKIKNQLKAGIIYLELDDKSQKINLKDNKFKYKRIKNGG